MKAVKIVLVVAALTLVASAGFCQSARVLGMGQTFVANPDGAFTAAGNPANLAESGIPAGAEGKCGWQVGAGATFSTNFGGADVKAYDAFIGGQESDWGFGAGWAHVSNSGSGNAYVAGYGSKIKAEGLANCAWGVSIAHVSGGGTSKTFGNVGITHDIAIGEAKAVKVGLLVADVTDQLKSVGGFGIGGGRTWAAGASFNVTPKILVALDLIGIGQPSKRAWNMGAEYRENEWALRAGDLNGQLAFGAGWKSNDGRWGLDYAHTQKQGGKINLVSGSYNF